MALYEHVMIARQDISNAQAESLIEHFGQVLKDNEGNVLETEYWGLRTMAYKINKNRKGHYGYFRTDSPSAAVQEMERLMRLHEDVMRVMTIRVDAHEEGPSAMMQSRGRDRERGDRDRGDRDRGPRRDDRRDDRGPRRDDRPRRDDAPAAAPAPAADAQEG